MSDEEQKEEQFEFAVKMAVIIQRPYEWITRIWIRKAVKKKQLDTTHLLPASRDRDSGQTSIPTETFAEAVLKYFLRLEWSKRAIHPCYRERCTERT